MTTLELDGGVQAIIESSNAWDVRYKLPLVAIHRNPAIYCAYVFKLMKDRGVEIPAEWRIALDEFYNGCRKDFYITTYPTHSGLISHDDMIGWTYLSPRAALDILRDLEITGSVVLDEKTNSAKDYSRFIFMMPFMQMRVFKKTSYFNQFLYCLSLMFHAATYNTKAPKDSGSLKLWLMNEHMINAPLCYPVIKLWQWIMKRRGVTIHKIFSERYLKEVPVFEVLSRWINGI
jgi:hypothetical protein